MIASVKKAMSILKVISNSHGRAVTLSEIAENCALPKPTCSHLLKALAEDGYVNRISQREGYELGPALYYLTRHGRYGEKLISICRPIMKRMEHSTHATVVLSVIKNGKKFIIDFADAEQKMFTDRSRIKSDDVYRTATGRAILAHLNHEDVRRVWEQCGQPPKGHWDEVDSFEALLSALKIIKKYRIVSGSVIKADADAPYTVGFASPIFKGGVCIGAIGIAWQSNTGTPSEKTEKMLKATLLRGAREINRILNEEETIG